MKYLVTGATGKVGRHVVHHLVANGHHVRALTRHAAKAVGLPDEVEVAVGDLTQPESLREAMRDIAGIHLLTVGGDDYGTLTTGPDIVRLAEEAGVERVAVLWNGQPGPVERVVESSSLRWTMLRPTDFMANMLSWAPTIRAGGVISEPFANVAIAVIDEYDVGAVAARVLTEDGHAGQTYTLTGPQALTPPQRLAAIGAAVGRELRFEELTEGQARRRWKEAGHGDELIEILVAWQGNPPEQARIPNPAVERLLGRPPRTVTRWAASHRAHFAGAV